MLPVPGEQANRSDLRAERVGTNNWFAGPLPGSDWISCASLMMVSISQVAAATTEEGERMVSGPKTPFSGKKEH